MLDIHTRVSAGCHPPVIRNAEFFRIELAPLIDGKILVSLTATTVDEQEPPRLLDQEIACDRVGSIDDIIALIRTHVRVVSDRIPANLG
jgi:hypothetical protein